MGIKKLIRNGAYSAAYPLHDGNFHSNSEPSCIREVRKNKDTKQNTVTTNEKLRCYIRNGDL